MLPRKKLASIMAKIDPEDLTTVARKNRMINFRATEDEQAEIKEIAKALDLSVSDYLSAMHRLTYDRWKRGRKRGPRR